MRRILASLSLTLCACIVVPSQEPWAPLELRVAPQSGGELFVYVDDTYRGNFVDASFRIYLTAGSHTVRVHGPANQTWQREVRMSSPPTPMTLKVVPGSAE